MNSTFFVQFDSWSDTYGRVNSRATSRRRLRRFLVLKSLESLFTETITRPNQFAWICAQILRNDRNMQTPTESASTFAKTLFGSPLPIKDKKMKLQKNLPSLAMLKAEQITSRITEHRYGSFNAS
ncbi:hypothetical protein Tcan_08872 [Toxocara canis]|uniref:Uncharacterized protein n=1 Tax=Toxocara canis TaxID=6265 RepID=A0A0B2VWX6_TOXCA|nr:hypothetical protein Tcan_08872 [Toxocara canis]